MIHFFFKIPEYLGIWFSWIDSGLSIFNLVLWLIFNVLHNSRWITFPTQLYLLLNSFYDCLLHLLPCENNRFIFFFDTTIGYYQFLLLYDWFWKPSFVLLSKKIQYFSWGFPFLAMSTLEIIIQLFLFSCLLPVFRSFSTYHHVATSAIDSCNPRLLVSSRQNNRRCKRIIFLFLFWRMQFFCVTSRM